MNTQAIHPLIYNVDEACQALGLSRTVIYELIRSGRLRSIKQGRRRLVPLQAVEDYVRAMMREAVA